MTDPPSATHRSLGGPDCVRGRKLARMGRGHRRRNGRRRRERGMVRSRAVPPVEAKRLPVPAVGGRKLAIMKKGKPNEEWAGAAGIVHGRGGKWICVGAICWWDGRRDARRWISDRGPFRGRKLARMRKGELKRGMVHRTRLSLREDRFGRSRRQSLLRFWNGRAGTRHSLRFRSTWCRGGLRQVGEARSKSDHPLYELILRIALERAGERVVNGFLPTIVPIFVL
jgi:hypothetical protein